MRGGTDVFDAVVVGSGFGGAVAAFRLAQSGLRVCVLERGRAWAPGDFPRDPRAVGKNLWDPEADLHGLFEVHLSARLAAVTAAGLGGGSLIYANVLMRKEPTPEDANGAWPFSPGTLTPHYERVEAMLKPELFPADQPPYRDTPKMIALQRAARQLGHRYRPLPLAVRFAPSGASDGASPGAPLVGEPKNLHGRARSTCRLCGECLFGCNYGSKTTLDLTYLSEALRLGAEIRTLSEVVALEPAGPTGYQLTVRRRDAGDGGATAEVVGRVVVLAAGSLGTTRLLLRNRRRLPRLSARLGSAFNGNGDLLAFTRGGRGDLEPTHGPVITGSVEADGVSVQDTAFPAFVAWMAEGLRVHRLGRLARFTARIGLQRLGVRRRSNFGSAIAELMATESLWQQLPLCSMGPEPASGRLYLTPAGELELDWDLGGSREYYERVRKVLRDVAATFGARTVDLLTLLGGRLSTVHPLGGCPMGPDPSRGVVDARGQVFGYPGLYVADGSVLPGALGVNPSLTIAALADHFADGIVASYPEATA